VLALKGQRPDAGIRDQPGNYVAGRNLSVPAPSTSGELHFGEERGRFQSVPVIAIILIEAFPFDVAVAITLGVLAVTPVPPLLPKSQLTAGPF
jgi:hypothetical protein